MTDLPTEAGLSSTYLVRRARKARARRVRRIALVATLLVVLGVTAAAFAFAGSATTYRESGSRTSTWAGCGRRPR